MMHISWYCTYSISHSAVFDFRHNNSKMAATRADIRIKMRREHVMPIKAAATVGRLPGGSGGNREMAFKLLCLSVII